MRLLRRLCLPLLLSAASIGVGACSTNPATGEQSFTAFMSPQEELEVGAKEHPKILLQFGGTYNDPDLEIYVTRIGNKLAKYSELPDLDFKFVILNDEKVNAFALPGGYVYITRGLLAIAADEAEMAGVLAHEIGHVTGRHTAQRYSAAMATNIGLQVLGVIGSAAGLPAGTSNLASLGAQVALQSYSREQELESDMLGVRYLSRAGYDPTAMIGFFRKLEAHTKLKATIRGEKGASQSRSILSTHPLTSERIAEATRLTEEAGPNTMVRGKAAFAENIDGMVFGDHPDQGIRRGRVFEHPGLGIRFEVPPGFTMINSPSQLIARSQDDSMVIFDMAVEKKVRQLGGIRPYLKAIRINGNPLQEIENLTVNGMPAVTGIGKIGRGNEKQDIRLLVVEGSRDQIFRLHFRSYPKNTKTMALAFRRTTYSFKRLSRREVVAIKPLRIRIKTVHAGDSAETFAKRMPMEKFGLEWFELLNGVARGEALKPGSTVRVVAE